MTKLAAASIPTVNDKRKNLDKMLEYVKKAADQNADLIAFPELCLSGFGENPMLGFNTDDALYYRRVAELVPEGPSVQELIEAAKQYDIYICWSMTEQDEERTDVVYNAGVMVGPEGYVGKYRKVHLPLTERLINRPGTHYPVFDTKIGKIGMQVCFDKMYPEVTRSLVLDGAKIIVSMTGWPVADRDKECCDYISGDIFGLTRAAENMVFFVESTTCGEGFMGHSRILGPSAGQVFATTEWDEGLAIAEVDIESELQQARIVSLHGSDLVKDRWPSTYGRLTEIDKYAPYSLALKDCS